MGIDVVELEPKHLFLRSVYLLVMGCGDAADVLRGQSASPAVTVAQELGRIQDLLHARGRSS